jgi:undecaprenyl-diphosphatase
MFELVSASAFLSALAIFFGRYWDYAVVLALIGYVSLASAGSRRVRAHVTGLALVAAAIARFGVVEFIRLFYDRPRPFEDTFTPLILHDPGGSFPSGHATFFMALAAYFLLARQKKMGTFLLISAVLISASRVGIGIHYWSDILAGWGIGLVVALIVWYVGGKTGRG